MFAVSSVFKENSEALCSVHREMARQRYTCPKTFNPFGLHCLPRHHATSLYRTARTVYKSSETSHTQQRMYV